MHTLTLRKTPNEHTHSKVETCRQVWPFGQEWVIKQIFIVLKLTKRTVHR